MGSGWAAALTFGVLLTLKGLPLPSEPNLESEQLISQHHALHILTNQPKPTLSHLPCSSHNLGHHLSSHSRARYQAGRMAPVP